MDVMLLYTSKDTYILKAHTL